MYALFLLLSLPPPLWGPWLLRAGLQCLVAALLSWRRPPPRPWVPRRGRTCPTPRQTPPAAPRAHWRKKPDWVGKEVLRLAVFLPSCRAVAAAFNAIHGQRATVGKSYVHEVCRAHERQLRLQRREMRRRSPRAVPVGEAFSLDLTTVRVAGQRCLVLGLIDQGSRRALRLKVLTHKCVWTLLAELCAAIAEHGRPRAIRTDNEAMFTSRACKVMLKAFGIRHERSGVRRPWQNGRMERFFGTLKALLAKLTLPSPLALQAALDEFVRYYNHVRAHQGLGGLTPAQAWRGLTVADVRRHAGRGRWVQAFDGLLVGYYVRC